MDARGEYGNTALHLAASEGHYHCVNYLLESGAQVKIKNHFGNTPFDLASQELWVLQSNDLFSLSSYDAIISVGALKWLLQMRIWLRCRRVGLGCQPLDNWQQFQNHGRQFWLSVASTKSSYTFKLMDARSRYSELNFTGCLNGSLRVLFPFVILAHIISKKRKGQLSNFKRNSAFGKTEGQNTEVLEKRWRAGRGCERVYSRRKQQEGEWGAENSHYWGGTEASKTPRRKSTGLDHIEHLHVFLLPTGQTRNWNVQATPILKEAFVGQSDI